MQYRDIGKSGIKASVVGLGAWAIGGWMWGEQDDQESLRSLQAALDHGINLIDTAAVYGFGRSEEVVGKALRGRRDQIVLATKCGLRWEGAEPRQGKYHFSADSKGIRPKEGADRHVYRFLNGASIRREIEESLRRLGTDVIDLYQTHWQEPTTPISETMETLLQLKQEGKIRAIGVSNATVQQMQEYLAAGQLDADQEKYSMLDRGLETSNISFCRKRKIAFLAYSPLANGLLTGKIGPERSFGEGDLRRESRRFTPENRIRVEEFLKELAPVAAGRGVSLDQLVIAWTFAQPGVSHALVGIRNTEQARVNAQAGGIELTREELDMIESAIRRHGSEIV